MKSAAAIILVAGLSTIAQAADTGALTLACTGTTASTFADQSSGSSPVSMGLIVSLAAGTVEGFSAPGAFHTPIKITGTDEVTFIFSGSTRIDISRIDSQEWSINGTINRVTGDVWADETHIDTNTRETLVRTVYTLKCKPTQRMF